MVEGLADDAGVAARGAVGDALLLEENDLSRRRELLQEEGRPEAREAAADDRDVGLALARERRAPPAAAGRRARSRTLRSGGSAATRADLRVCCSL